MARKGYYASWHSQVTARRVLKALDRVVYEWVCWCGHPFLRRASGTTWWKRESGCRWGWMNRSIVVTRQWAVTQLHRGALWPTNQTAKNQPFKKLYLEGPASYKTKTCCPAFVGLSKKVIKISCSNAYRDVVTCELIQILFGGVVIMQHCNSFPIIGLVIITAVKHSRSLSTTFSSSTLSQLHHNHY